LARSFHDRLSDEYKKDNPHVQQGWIQVWM